MRLLEGAQAARATATGMAAVTSSLLCFLKSGDHVVAARALFGSCRYVVEDLCPRYGIASTLVDGRDLDAWKRAMRPNTKAVFFETPANPTLDLVDIAAVSEIAHKAGALVVVDNVFATPVLQKPLKLGADVVVYSATKHVDGQGRCLGGIVLGSQAYVKDHLHNYLKHTGPSLSPFNAWVMLKGLETLPLRVRAQCEGAARIADHLAAQKGVTRVLYCGREDHPQAALAKRQMSGFGQVVTFEVAGGKAAAFRFVNALRLVKISNNLGDAKSLDHASRHHHAPAPEARCTRRARHLRRHAAALRRPRVPRRPHRRHRPRAGGRTQRLRRASPRRRECPLGRSRDQAGAHAPGCCKVAGSRPIAARKLCSRAAPG